MTKTFLSESSESAESVAMKDMQGEFGGHALIRIDSFWNYDEFRHDEASLRKGMSPYYLIHRIEIEDIIA